jgi:DNA-binding transcriptional LysR family regulator
MNHEALKILLEVSRAGNFATVAEDRGVAPSSISRAVASLEAELGVRLFHRTTRKLSPTEAGATYMGRIAPLIEEFEAAREEAIDLTVGPKGRLRVTASTSFGQIALAPLIGEFCDAFPNISMELILSDRHLDLVEERIDLALRHGTLRDSSMISSKLRAVKYKLVASPQFLAQSGEIQTPADLTHHSLITFPFEGFRDKWHFAQNGKTTALDVEPRLVVSNAAALKELALEGAGITLLADWTVARALENGELKEVLSDWVVTGAPGEAAIWMVYPSRSFVPSKTRTFIDFLHREMHGNER